MHEFHATYHAAFAGLQAQYANVALWRAERGSDALLTPEEAHVLFVVVDRFHTECQKVEFKRPVDRFPRVAGVEKHRETFNLETLEWQLKELIEAAMEEVVRRKFFVLAEEDAHYFNKKHPFGETVYNNFESVRHDVRESWNCFALGRYTACIFHSMRVLEKGLHALVHDLNDNYSAGIVFNATVEETNWGNIINEIQIALENPKRTKRLNPIPDKQRMGFYSRASLEFEYFKHAWRDDVSHSRASYDRPAAKSVMSHVESFMRVVAENLQE